MDWIYIVGGTLYVAMACLFLWTADKGRDFWGFLHYYKPERGGYTGQDGNWVGRKVIWRAWGWNGVLALIVLSLPLILLFVLAWGRLVEPLLTKKLPDKQKAAPVSISGGDGSSAEAAIVISAENSQDGIGAEYRYIQQRHGIYKVAWKRHFQAKIRLEGREYDLLTIMLTADGTKRKYWFDITSFYGKWR